MGITRTESGPRLIVTLPDNKKKSIRLGRVSMETARAIERHVKHIVQCLRTSEEINRGTQEWIRQIREQWPSLANRLNAIGLIRKRIANPNFAAFVATQIESRRDVKPATLKVWRQSLAYIKEYISEKNVRGLTKADGKAFLSALLSHQKKNGDYLSPATVGKYFCFTRQFLNEAVDMELIAANPFRGISAPRKTNKKRQCIVDGPTLARVLAVISEPEMRLIVALSRFGGLRTPSETYCLRWEHIDFVRKRITVISPKTERHAGHGSRELPLFPELLPFLDACKDSRQEHDGFLISKRRRNQSDANLRRRFTTLVRRAGVKPWPKIFHNLRATRQNELERKHPTHVVCSWMGNSQKVAFDHYLQVTDEDFAKAITAKPAFHSDEPGVVTQVVMQDAENSCNGMHGTQPEKPITPKNKVFPGVSSIFENQETGVDGNRTHLATFQRPQRI